MPHCRTAAVPHLAVFDVSSLAQGGAFIKRCDNRWSSESNAKSLFSNMAES